ncbi:MULTISPECIES: 2-hydroxyacid dehydrogenase [Actinokineospora]|uniref:Phosphoglycerate dehydrogenase n=1 Tax=Actinokineospora fastidiosa TaxID=1816 RepID=A0A918LID9_9PSEU|nr:MULTISPECIES: 2-hydroxyacid dehydrogenase [Actinokineospora]UVS81241.1 Glyoxylate/hydroxypyruvate reductase A [Actinokineospora sp. UTMC 2448]GGS52299.1 phosphoglycerate dehydrogenase [Actinokineospora fastidiosa]
MTVTVLVPDEHGVAALSDLDGVRAVRYPSLDELPAEAAEAQVLVPGIGVPPGPDVYSRLPALRLVQLLTAGVEHWTGTVPEGVMLSTGRGAHGASTAEWAMTALLTVYREFREFEAARIERRWASHVTETLQGKRVLVLGAGDLGQDLRRKLDAFDAHATLVGTRARDGVHGLDELDALIPEHDAVVLVVPLTSATRGMVDARFLARMPDGAILVNAARGAVVDTDALLAELRSGRLRAALDVTDPEPLPSDHPLWSAPGLLLTPHVGGACAGHRDRAYRVVAEQVARFVAGERPANLVRGEY